MECKKAKLWTKNFILLMAASMCSGFLVSFFLNTLPIFAEQMTGTAVYAGLVTTCYTLAALATRPVVGVMCEKLNGLKMMIIGLALMTVSCYAYTFASGIATLIFIRIVHGIGFGIKSTASGVIAAELIPKSRFAEGIGMFGLYLPITNAIGPAVALWILNSGSFNILFLISGVIGLIGVILACMIRNSKGSKTANNVENNENNLSDSSKVDDLTDISENADKNTHLPKAFLGFEFGVVFPSLVLMLMYFGYGAVISFVALYAVSVGIDGIGLFFTISAIALFVARLLFAKLVIKYGYHRFVILSLIFFTGALLLIPHMTNIIALYIIAVFYGAGLGIVPMAVNAQVLERCTEKRRGTAMAAYTSSMDLGIGIGSMVMGVVVEISGFTGAFTLAGIMCAVAVVLYCLTVMRDHSKYIERMERINSKTQRN